MPARTSPLVGALLSLVGAIALTALAPLADGAARACSCRGPDAAFISSSGPLPSDARGVMWALGWRDEPVAAIDKFTVERMSGPDQWKVVPHTIEEVGPGVVLVAPEAMKAGERLRFTALTLPVELRPSIVVDVVAQVLGAELGKARLTVGARKRGAMGLARGASCSGSFEVDAYPLAFELPVALQPYREALMYETLVDGSPWKPRRSLCQTVPAGRSWQAVGEDVVLRRCNGDGRSAVADLAEGKHTVVMRASLPGTTVALELTADVTLSCK